MQKKDFENDEGEIVIPFVYGLVFPFKAISARLKEFLCLTGGVSLVVTLIMLLLGRGFLCNIPNQAAGFYCSYNLYSFGVSFLLLLFSLGFYFNRWQMVGFEGMSGKEAMMSRCWKRDFQAVAVILCYVAIWCGVGACIYFLDVKEPSQSWEKELLFFVIMSVLVLIGLSLLFNSVIFMRLLQGKKWLVLHQTFWPVFDNVYKIAGWFLCYMLFFAFVCRFVFGFIGNPFLGWWPKNMLGEFCLNFILYTIVSFFVSSFNYQEQYIFGKDK